MTEKCYRDINGDPIGSDYVVYEEEEQEEAIYIKDDWYKEPEQVYREILEENAYIYNQLVKEYQ